MGRSCRHRRSADPAPSRDATSVRDRLSTTLIRQVEPGLPFRTGRRISVLNESHYMQRYAAEVFARIRAALDDTSGRRPPGRGSRHPLDDAGTQATPKQREEDHVQEVFAVDRRRTGAFAALGSRDGPGDGRRAQVRNPERQAGPRPGPHLHRRRLHADRHDLQQPDPGQPRAQGRAAARPHLGGQRGQLGVDVPPRQERQVHQRPSGHRPRRQVLVRAHPRPGDRVQGPQGHGTDRHHHRCGRSHPGHQAEGALRGPAASARQHLRAGHRRGEPGGDQPQPGRLGAVHPQGVHPRQQGHPGEEPRLLRGRTPLPRRGPPDLHQGVRGPGLGAHHRRDRHHVLRSVGDHPAARGRSEHRGPDHPGAVVPAAGPVHAEDPLQRRSRSPGGAIRARPRGHARSGHRRPGLARQRHPRGPGQPLLQQGPAAAHARRREVEGSCWPRPAIPTAWRSRCSPPPVARDSSLPPSSPSRT